MKLRVADARTLAVRALRSLGFDEKDAAVTADHLVDAALRGVTFGSLPRILAIADRLALHGDKRRAIRIVRETPVSALLDGGDHVGYVVAHRATRVAIDKAKASGIAIVGARNTYYTGLMAHYLEMATREGLVAFAVNNGPAFVAPEGSTERRMGTNPVAFGFPAEGDPIIWDIGTCAIMHGDVVLHQRLGQPLPEGVAIDRNGAPTRDPAAALEGAFRAWGGHRGSGLSIVVQLLGAMCDTPVVPEGLAEMAYVVIVIDPAIFMPDATYPQRVQDYAELVRSARPAQPDKPVRMPFDRSASERRRRLREDAIDVPDRVHAALVELAERPIP
jgi:LDH2 family malate/lactate/ureidoglycolate dehydrogenase